MPACQSSAIQQSTGDDELLDLLRALEISMILRRIRADLPIGHRKVR